MLTSTFGTAAPEGSTTVPSIVPELPTDCAKHDTQIAARARMVLITPSSQTDTMVLLDSGNRVQIGDERARFGRERVAAMTIKTTMEATPNQRMKGDPNTIAALKNMNAKNHS